MPGFSDSVNGSGGTTRSGGSGGTTESSNTGGRTTSHRGSNARSSRLRGLVDDLETVRTTADRTAATVQQRASEMRSSMETAQAEVEQRTREIKGKLDQVERDVATRVDDLKFRLKQLADAGNTTANNLLGVIQQAEEGLINVQDVMGTFGDATITFEGRVRHIDDVLQDVLPTIGQVQSEIQGTIDQLRRDGTTIEELVQRLNQQTNTYAREFAKLVQAFLEGKVTLQSVIDQAQRLQEILPSGSETAALAGLLAEIALEDDN